MTAPLPPLTIPMQLCPCGKRAYLSHTHARWMAGRARYKNDHRVQVYRCPLSRRWHVGRGKRKHV